MKTMNTAILDELVALSRHLALPENDYVILAEGNTSARADEHRFWVKASGRVMADIGPDGFVQVRFDPILALLDGPPLDDAGIRAALTAAKVAADARAHPSVETVLHALCLQLPGVRFVGHTHPTAINAITCSAVFAQALSGRLFPDEIVVCGVAPLLVPYVDPGLPLARAVRDGLRTYLDTYGEPPKTIYMQNHGFIALGATAAQVANITAMATKAARILIGAYSLGGPNFLTPEHVARIHTRPDELYRRQQLGVV
jgi:rhamnose utilization protein RhaD (predicted bifunctional aldolase and dehydrogenase)